MFAICGLNHKTAPLDLREQFCASAIQIFEELLDTPFVEEGAMLNTCNRTEFYCYIKNYDLFHSWIINHNNTKFYNISPHLYLHTHQNAIKHALNVACGLDSMMIGEPQIFGQLKQCYQDACKNARIKTKLHQIFQYIFKASKNIRNKSGIGKNPISIASAATQLIANYFQERTDLNIMIIGSGDTAALVAKYLYKSGIKNFIIANRTLEKALQLADIYNGKAISINEITAHIKNVDVLLSATSCPLPFIDKQFLINAGIHNSQNRSLFLLDLAIPRDINIDVLELNKIKLYNIDDLQKIILKGQAQRQIAAENAQKYILDELEHYDIWQNNLYAKKNICEYRLYMQNLAKIELERAVKRLNKGEDSHEILQEFSHRLINKIMHEPSIYLRNQYIIEE